MHYVPRIVQSTVLKAACGFPAVALTGPRRAGKTTLLRRLFPRASYVLLEDPDVQARARSDPRALLEELRLPALLDEIQNVPELLAYIRTRIDQSPREKGRWLFTGSQEAPSMQGISESMAGRAAVLQLLPFSLGETDRVSLLLGGYPERYWRAPQAARCGSALSSRHTWNEMFAPSRTCAIWRPSGASLLSWPAATGKS